MKSRKATRIRDTVYVVGAGFSAGLGYPLTKSLLIGAWKRLPKDARSQLQNIVEFHHPGFTSTRTTSFPDIEQLLTEMAVNLQMFEASRPVEGGFTKDQLRQSMDALLSTVASWFHDIYESASTKHWLTGIVERIQDENAAIVSFNWDLVLDHLLFGKKLTSESYGLSPKLGDGPLLLKPHGSLNWYEGTQLKHVPDMKQVEIFPNDDVTKCVHAFLRPRGIKTKSGRKYSPLIIPPTYFKDFTPAVFQRLWRNCTDVLSTPKQIIFLGYSLPTADMHAHFIFRCGFYNQMNGRLKANGGRYPETGPSEVIIVNPDQDAARRIEAVAGPHIHCEWVPKQIEEWLEECAK